MAITYDNPEVNAMGISPIDRSRINGEIQPQQTLAQRVQAERMANTPTPSVIMNPKLKGFDTMATGAEASNPERALDQSDIDRNIDWNYNPLKSNDIGDLRAEAQGHWGRLKTATMNNITILGTSLASDVVSLTGGLLSAAIQGDISKMWDNDATNYLNDVQRRALNRRQIYRGQDYENRGALGRLGTGIFWADLWQNAGYMEGMLIPGMAVGKLAQASKLLAKAPTLTKLGTNTIAAIGEASMEALNQKKDSEQQLLQQADMLFRQKILNATTYQEKDQAYDDYSNDLLKIQNDIVKIGNRTFGGNVALLTATGTIEFGDFVSRGYAESHKLLQQIARDASGKAIGRSIFNSVSRGIGQTAKNFLAEGFEEYAQRSLASGAAKTRKANSFLEKYQDELNIELADNYFSAVAEDLYNDLENPEAWTEFLSGALMGSIGIPGSHNGLISNLKDSYKEGKKIENLANQINTFELENQISSKNLRNNGKAQAMFDALIRHAGINEVQNQALIDRDKKTFVDSRVEKVLNMAYLYDNIGEIDEFKKRLEWYSKIENDEQLEQLINQTQEVEKDENGQIRSVIKSSPFAGLSKEEVNQKLKETNDFYQKIVDDYIEGKNFIDDSTAGKLDEDTLKRGAAAYAQSKNFDSRAKEMHKDVVKAIDSYRDLIVKKDDTSEKGKFVNNFLDSIHNLSENEIVDTFSSMRTKGAIISFGEYINQNSSKISNSDIIKDIYRPIIDIAEISIENKIAENEVNSIIKNAEKEKGITKRLFDRIKNTKKNYLVKKYAKQLSNITDKQQLEERIKNLPKEIKDDVLDYLKENGSEATRNLFKDMSEWENAQRAIYSALDTYNSESHPITRDEANKKYGEEVITDVIHEFTNFVQNSSSMNEFNDKTETSISLRKDSLKQYQNNSEEFKLKNEELSKRLSFVDELRSKINKNIKESNNANNEKAKQKDTIDFDNAPDLTFDEDFEPSSSTQPAGKQDGYPSYIVKPIKEFIEQLNTEGFDFVKDKLINIRDNIKDIITRFPEEKDDPDGSKNVAFINDWINKNDPSANNNDALFIDFNNDDKTNLGGLQPSPPQTPQPNEKQPTNRYGLNVANSMRISKYNHTEAANHKAVLYKPEDNTTEKKIQDLLNEYKAYEFVDNGFLNTYKEFLIKNNKGINDIIKYIKTTINGESVYLLALESNDFLNAINTKKLDVNGTTYQIVGTLSYFPNEQGSINEFQKLSKLIDGELGNVEENQFKVSEKYSNGISKINAGRLVYQKTDNPNEEFKLKDLLSNIPRNEFEIGAYGSDGSLILNPAAESKRHLIKEPSVSESKASAKAPGVAYIFVKCADGYYYPRQIRSKKLRASELTEEDLNNDPLIKGFKKLLGIIADTKKPDSERAQAKGFLKNYLVFGEVDLNRYISFRNDPRNGQNVVTIGIEDDAVNFIEDHDGNEITVENLFNELTRDNREVIFGPRFDIKTKFYNELKDEIKGSFLLHSNVKLKTIDCNFELFSTDENGVVNIQETKPSSSSGKAERNSWNLSLVKEQVEMIWKELDMSDSIKSVKYKVGEDGILRVYINDNIPKTDDNISVETLEQLDWIGNCLYDPDFRDETGTFEKEFYNDYYGIYMKVSKGTKIVISEIINDAQRNSTEGFNKYKKYEEKLKAQAAQKANEMSFDEQPIEKEEVETKETSNDSEPVADDVFYRKGESSNDSIDRTDSLPFHVEINTRVNDSDCLESAMRCNKK